jgi:hypothetical protein
MTSFGACSQLNGFLTLYQGAFSPRFSRFSSMVRGFHLPILDNSNYGDSSPLKTLTFAFAFPFTYN